MFVLEFDFIEVKKTAKYIDEIFFIIYWVLIRSRKKNVLKNTHG
jgi:hypothetical protein